jgi:hypothetical protein
MTPDSVPKLRASPPLTEAQERVLKAVNDVPFSGVQEIKQLVFPKGSLSSARAVVRELAGGKHADEENNDGYLIRVSLPTRGHWLPLYVVGNLGTKYLRKIGVQVTWRVRRYKLRQYSFSYLRHQHAVAKLMTALLSFCRDNPDPAYRVVEVLNSYDLLKDPPRARLITDGEETTVSVIPDFWAYVERVADGRGTGLWCEVDNNGNEYRRKFTRLLRSRLALLKLKNGYQDYFGTASAILCYLVIGTASEQHRKSRLRAICRWTKEVLAQEKLENWACVFRFAVLDDDISITPLWTARLWYQLYSFHRVRLLDPITPTEQTASSATKENTDGHTNPA